MPSPLRVRTVVLALAAVASGPSAAAAQPDRALIRKLDSIAGADVRKKESVGTVVAVVRGGGRDTLLLRGYGRADVERNAPMPTDALFEIGSITKQFTAVAILQLRDAGKLSLDDDVTRWLPDFDTRGHRVPLRRLLDHTSGIADVTQRWEFGVLLLDVGVGPATMYSLIKRRGFQVPPGAAQIYNNSAFWLLGRVIEKASGMTYDRYVESGIFAPLGMKSSRARCSAANVPHRPQGYILQNGEADRASYNTPHWYVGSGALCSTAGDLLTWLTALHGGRVLSPRSYAELVAPATLNDGTRTRYAMGLEVAQDAHGLDFIGHSGEIAGFAARANWYPAARMAVVVLMNNSVDASPSAMAANLAAEVLPVRPLPATPFRGDPPTGTAQAFAPFVGTYEGPARGGDMEVVVTRTPQGLAFSIGGAPARELPWAGGLTFRNGHALLTFRRGGGAGAPATELRYDAGSGYYRLARR